MDAPLSRERLEGIAHDLEGTCETLGAYIERHDLDMADDELEDQLLDVSLELCLGCGWWHRSSDLIGEDDSNPGYCDQCREDDAD